jgi:hypothetical protein
MVFRVAEPGLPAFQLRPGEEGLSVFQPGRVDPSLAVAEILEAFRPGSCVILRTVDVIEELGMQIIPIPGAGFLPPRLREAHAEIRPGPGMTRGAFKQALKELE